MLVNRRRVLATGALAVASSLLLGACGSSDDSGSDDSSSGSTTLTMWVDAERAPALKDAAASFKKDKDVEVKLVIKDFQSARDDFITQVPTGKGPDMIVGPHDWVGKFVQNGVVAPLELGDKAGDFEDAAVQAMTYEGKTYGLPYAIENVALVRNTALLDTPAQTMDDVVAAGNGVVKAGKAKYPFLVGLDPKQGDPYHLYGIQTSYGAPVFERNDAGDYDPNQLGLGNPGGVEFAKDLAAWSKAGALNPSITGDIAKTAFNKGESPYFLTGPWNVPDMQKAGLEIAIDPIPTGGDEAATPFIGVNGFFISSKATNALAASEFVLNYLSTEDAQDALFKTGGRPPALKASFEKAASDPIVAAFGEIGKTGAPMPAIPQMDAVWADWGATELDIIKGKVDPATAWPKMVQSVQSKVAG
ncbi:maltose ABC transporter substrate-binding protein [Mumia zhuanghuii]|uniref:Maltose ABC transporter substrate-binding protein n=1 Tax=Mumia zhuanghuii TaxID=2585211 RepID=A0A5Q6S028_9ACTN|nr:MULTISPECIES: maltose ABC transporter substrate-binding protein [Mumia]KAA1423683.1 maltose ABC transporter substrate-binding protein [Mumia zhuanghuii]